MDLYKKVEKVIKDHIAMHQSEVRKGKELLAKIDTARCNDGLARKSIYYYDWDRNGKKENPFEIPDYTEL